MQKNVEYSTHSKVLVNHSSYDLVVGVDPDVKSRDYFKRNWKVSKVYSHIDEIENISEIEIVVICTPPVIRKTILDKFPNLIAIILEKPIANTLESSREFIDICNDRGIKLQVNLTRRSDKEVKKLASGKLKDLVGEIQTVFGVYGNGLYNNGIHMVDLVRMLFGEIRSVQAINPSFSFKESPIKNDYNFAFQLLLENNSSVIIYPIKFSYYRENSLDIYGTKARLELIHEGLDMILTPVAQCRSFSLANELASDKKKILHLDYGDSLYNLYDNLIQNIESSFPLDCSGETALKSTEIIESIFSSFKLAGKIIEIKNEKFKNNYIC